MNKKFAIANIAVFALIFLAGAIDVNSQEHLGCCINPDAHDVTLICNPVPVPLSECCSNADDSEACKNAHFRQPPSDPNNACEGIDECKKGCCCPPLPATVGGTSDTTAPACRTPRKFVLDDVACTSCSPYQCSDGIDNDNDGCIDWQHDPDCTGPEQNAESTFNIECKDENPGCKEPSYTPTIELTVTPVPGKKEFKISWTDECDAESNGYAIKRCEGPKSECGFANPNYVALDPPNADASTIIDNSQELKFNKYNINRDSYEPQHYTYMIIGSYENARESKSISEAKLGNIECWNQQQDAGFCLSKFYYSRYKDHLLAQSDFRGVTTGEFPDKVERLFKSNFNKRGECHENILSTSSCAGGKVCSNADGDCVEVSECNIEQQYPFGMYAARDICESKPFCFWDRTKTIVNSCFSCNMQEEAECYDYKTREACESNRCSSKNCKWKQGSAFGAGVCVDLDKFNCEFCGKEGSGVLDNTIPNAGDNLNTFFDSYNNIFDACSRAKSNLLEVGKIDTGSGNEYLCYYKEDKRESINCNEVVCTDYIAGSENCNARTSKNPNTNEITGSNDHCNIGKCSSFDDGCFKDADADNVKDCNDASDKDLCEKDFFPPKTTLDVIQGGSKKIRISIRDKPDSKSSYLKVADGRDKFGTYICAENCQTCTKGKCESGYKVTNSVELSVAGVGIYDGKDNLIDFGAEGTHTIRFYSVDKYDNMEIIDSDNTKQVSVFPANEGPVIGSIRVLQDGQEISPRSRNDNNIYTKNPEKLRLVFVDAKAVGGQPRKVELLELALRKEGASDKTSLGTNIGQKETNSNIDIDFPSSLEEGTYDIILNAKYVGNGKEMNNANKCPANNPSCPKIVVDRTTPSLTIRVDGEELRRGKKTIRKSNPEIKLIFNKENIELVSVTIKKGDVFVENKANSEPISNLKGDFSAPGYKNSYNLNDGTYEIEVKYQDLAGNKLISPTRREQFEINAKPLTIILVEPINNVADKAPYNVVFETDNSANCEYGWSAPSQTGFNGPYKKSELVTGGTRHTLTASRPEPRRLWVKCFDGSDTVTEDWLLGADSAIPRIGDFEMFPITRDESGNAVEPTIVSGPRELEVSFSTYRGASNEKVDTKCKYKIDSQEDKYFDETFKQDYDEEISVDHLSVNTGHTISFQCENKAGSLTDSITKRFTINEFKDLAISVTKPAGSSKEIKVEYNDISVSNVELEVETDKPVKCGYSFEDKGFDESLESKDSSSAYRRLYRFNLGLSRDESNKEYNVYVVCKDQYQSSYDAGSDVKLASPVLYRLVRKYISVSPKISSIIPDQVVALAVQYEGVDDFSFDTVSASCSITKDGMDNVIVNGRQKGDCRISVRDSSQNLLGVINLVVGDPIPKPALSAECTNCDKSPIEITVSSDESDITGVKVYRQDRKDTANVIPVTGASPYKVNFGLIPGSNRIRGVVIEDVGGSMVESQESDAIVVTYTPPGPGLDFIDSPTHKKAGKYQE